jgi:hypothetical protein
MYQFHSLPQDENETLIRNGSRRSEEEKADCDMEKRERADNRVTTDERHVQLCRVVPQLNTSEAETTQLSSGRPEV